MDLEQPNLLLLLMLQLLLILHLNLLPQPNLIYVLQLLVLLLQVFDGFILILLHFHELVGHLLFLMLNLLSLLSLCLERVPQPNELLVDDDPVTWRQISPMTNLLFHNIFIAAPLYRYHSMHISSVGVWA